jgi:hypothetical protein
MWRSGETVYVARDVTAGAAVWAPVITDYAAICNVTTGAVAAYGTILLNSSYTGPAINVVRASDGTNLDIGFVLVGKRKVLDEAALDTFLIGTTGAVATLYDQSGNANHATQATAVNRPVIAKKTIGGVRVITFVGDTLNGTIQALTLPAGVSLPRAANSQYAVLTPFTTVRPNAFWEVGSSTGAQTLVYSDATGGIYRSNFFTAAANPMFPVRTDPSVMSAITDTSACALTQNNITGTGFGTTAATITGGQIGNTIRVANYQGRFDLGALILYPTKHNAASQEAVMTRLYRSFGISPQSDVQVVYDGDSITYGRTLITGNDISAQTPSLTGEVLSRVNYGIGGQAQSEMTTNYPTRAQIAYLPSKLNILKIFAGTNDIHLNGATGAATWASAVSEMQAARATGYKILITTMLPRFDFTTPERAERDAFNALVRANWATYADGILDYAADPTMGALAAVSNTVLYADGVHPTEYGDGLLANIDAGPIAALVKTFRMARSA